MKSTAFAAALPFLLWGTPAFAQDFCQLPGMQADDTDGDGLGLSVLATLCIPTPEGNE